MAEAAVPEISLSTGSEFVFDVVCAPCSADGQQKEAESYCQDCLEHLCGQCVRYHTRLSSLKHHRLVDKDAAPPAQDDQQVRDVCAERCQDHRNEIVKYFCPDHKALACGVCVTLDHKRCEHMTYIHDAAVGLEDGADYKQFMSGMEDLRQQSEGTVTLALESKQRSSDCHTKVIHDIDAYREELVSAVDCHVDAIRDQVDQIHAQDADRMDLIATKGNSILEELQSVTTSISSLQAKKHFCKIFVVMKQKEDHFTELKMCLEKASDEEVEEFSFQRDDELRAMIGTQDGLGKIVSTSSKIGDSFTARTSRKSSDGTQEVKEPSRDVNDIKASRMEDIVVKSVNNKKTCQITGMTMVSDSKLVAADNWNGTIKLIDTTTCTLLSEHTLNGYPWDVAVCNAIVATTIPSTSQIVFLDHTRGLVHDGEISVNGNCKGIDWHDDKLYVVFDLGHKLKVMTTAGVVLQTINTAAGGEQLLQKPTYLTVSAVNQRIYVTSWGKGQLIVLNMDGKQMSCDDGEPRWLKYMAVDRSGMLYLCDYSNDKIELLSHSGEKPKTLLTKTDGLVSPYSMCYCETTRRLFVGMYKCDNICVYQIS